MKRSRAITGAVGLALAITTLVVWWRFDSDIRRARSRVAQGSLLLSTRCGPIEYQEAGTGVPLLAIHGSGGGYDQGMAIAGVLADQGIRVIAMYRFGYLRTPMHADASAAGRRMLMCACSMRWVFARPPSWVARQVRLPHCRWPSATRIGSAPSCCWCR